MTSQMRLYRLSTGVLLVTALLGISAVVFGTQGVSASRLLRAPLRRLVGEFQVIFTEPDVFPSEIDMICDNAGHAYAVWYANMNKDFSGQSDLLYFTESDGSSWTQPTDIVVRDSRWPALAITRNRRLSLARKSGQCIRMMSASSSHASQPQDWQDMGCTLTDKDISSLDVVVGAGNVMHLVYTSEQARVVYARSIDYGHTWQQTVISEGDVPGSARAESAHIALDLSSRIHVVWSEEPVPFNESLGVRYSRSVDNGTTWQVPVWLAERASLQPNIVAVGTSELHAVWNTNVGLSNRAHRMSLDGGETWMPATVISSLPGGILGSPAIASDGDGKVHVLMAQDNGLAYNQWQDGGWSGVEERLSGLPTNFPAMCIDRGRTMYAAVLQGQTIWAGVFDTGATEVPSAQFEERTVDQAYPFETGESPLETPRGNPSSEETGEATRTMATNTWSRRLDTGQDASRWLPTISGLLAASLVVGYAFIRARLKNGRKSR